MAKCYHFSGFLDCFCYRQALKCQFCIFCVDRCYGQLQLLHRLFYACMTYLKAPHLDLPVGLIERLVHTDVVFVKQFVSAVHNFKVRETCFFGKAMQVIIDEEEIDEW